MQEIRAARMVEAGKVVCETARAREPQPGEVVVRTHFASICGSDLHMIFEPLMEMPYPLPPGFPGHEGVGAVVESAHPGFAPGDHVLNVPAPPQACCFADMQTLDGDHCIKLPEGEAGIQELLMAQQLGTVVFALSQFPVNLEGATCAVVGQGSAGMFFSALLKQAGAAKVVASDRTPDRRAAAAHFGTDVAVAPEEMLDAVLDETDGHGADIVVEAVGSSEALAACPELVRLDGSLLWFGLPDSLEPVEFDYATLFRKRVLAKSAFGAQGEPGLASFRSALDTIAARDIDVRPLLKHTFGIEDVEGALRTAYERDDGALKVSLRFD